VWREGALGQGLNTFSDDLTDRIYEASVLPECWPDVLGRVTGIVDGVGTLLIAARDTNFRITGSSPEIVKLAQEYFIRFRDNNERTRRLLEMRRAGFVSDSDAFSPEELANEPIFRDFLTPRGLGRGIGTAIHLPEREILIFHTEGLYSPQPVDRASVQALDELRPHLARAALLSARLAFERARTAVDTLSSLGLGACAVTDTGVVIVGNEKFSGERGLWTTRGGGRVALHDRRADRMLYDTLAMAAGHATRSIALRDQDTGAPAVLHVVPVRRSAHDLFNRCVAILVLTKPVEGPSNALPLLQALFDLTATEADLAARIAAGQTTDEIAAREGKSVSTVRNQLKSALEKTGCRRQADLAGLLARLIPAGM
jgi:DNA-binding CsgD family transcriptional regulator